MFLLAARLPKLLRRSRLTTHRRIRGAWVFYMSGFQIMKSAKSKRAFSPVVMKFGGTSVENSEAIQRVTEIVASRKGYGRVVVVSALAKVTDQLVAMGQKAASGECDASLRVSKEQRERHLRTAKSLLGSKLF